MRETGGALRSWKRECELVLRCGPSRTTPIVRRGRTRFRSAGRRARVVATQAAWQPRGASGIGIGCEWVGWPRGSLERRTSHERGEDKAPRSPREVTRCEHPARADVGDERKPSQECESRSGGDTCDGLREGFLLVDPRRGLFRPCASQGSRLVRSRRLTPQTDRRAGGQHRSAGSRER